jgi:hypothetical protein
VCFIENRLDFRNHYRRRVDHLGAIPRRFNPRVHRLEFIEGKGFPEHVGLRLQIPTHVEVLAIHLVAGLNRSALLDGVQRLEGAGVNFVFVDLVAFLATDPALLPTDDPRSPSSPRNLPTHGH